MKLQQKLEDLIKEKGITKAYVCRAAGNISQSQLSQWLKGVYKGDNKTIDEAVEGFINKENLKLTLSNNTIEFVETSIANRVNETAKNCHYKAELGVVFGDAGLGKTTAVENYSGKNPDVILIKANPSYTKKYLIQELHKKVGCEGFGAIYLMLNDIISRLKDSGRLIIVDQAEYLSQPSLELLRTIHDEAKIGLLLVGMPKLYFNLKGKKGEFRQLFTRIGYKIKLENLMPEDTEMIVKNFLPESNDVWQAFHSVSLANTRALSMLLKRSIEIAELNDKDINKLCARDIKEVGEKVLIIEA